MTLNDELTAEQQVAEIRIGMPLRQYYIKRTEEGATMRDIARELRISYATAHRWRKELNLVPSYREMASVA